MMTFKYSERHLFTYYGVVKIQKDDIKKDIIKRVEKMEEVLTGRFNQLEDKLETGEDTFLLIRDGLKGYKERCLKDIVDTGGTSTIHKWREKARTDESLKWPHKKILDFMIGQYDYQKKQFKEKAFNEIVAGAKIGKNMAKEYLHVLQQKGYVDHKDTGYRHLYQIRDKLE